MATIAAFRGIRYTQRDQTGLIAPPYDILDAPEKAALLAVNEQNIVAVDLPHTPPKEAGPDSAYDAAAETLRRWMSVGTLQVDERPAIYVYHQHYRVDGREFVRRMFFARLKLEEFGRGQVFPHEQTFGGPKEDRLKLTRATGCNLSPIFGLYTDPQNAVASLFESLVSQQPHAIATLDGVENRLWVLTEPTTIERVRREMESKAVFIADGHHRYSTALNYRDEIAAGRGRLEPEDPANFVLCVFAAMEDPGVIIQATDRVLLDVPDLFDRLPGALADRFEWTPHAGDLPAALVAALGQRGPQAFGVFDGVSGRMGSLVPREPDLLAAFEPKRAAAWRRLSYAILHRYVLDEVVTPRLLGGRAPTIHYVRKLDDTVAEARQTKGVAFLMQPCTMAELRDVCTAGELMPQKTTYFYPKLATGLVINPLY